MQFVRVLLQRVWDRDYVGLYPLIQQVETGITELEEPVHSLVLEYKRISHCCGRMWIDDIGSYQTRTLELLGKAYGSIPPHKAAEYLGLSADTVIPGTLSSYYTEVY